MNTRTWTFLLTLGWCGVASAGPTPVTADGIATASCFGWDAATDSAFVARQKETCTPEAGCTLGAYLGKLGPTSGARTVAHVGLAKDAAGHVGVAALISSAKPKFLDKANAVLTAEADSSCETSPTGSPFSSVVRRRVSVSSAVSSPSPWARARCRSTRSLPGP